MQFSTHNFWDSKRDFIFCIFPTIFISNDKYKGFRILINWLNLGISIEL